jgi:EAL domain-containing protein (putative c-di-GMP-specific phosphodiesterase class I)/CheY-like chemotaxis protein
MADNVNRLLIVEEDAAVLDLVGNAAKQVGYAVASATSGARFVQLLESFQPSLVIIQLDLPDTDGVELLKSLAARACTAGVVIIGHDDERGLAAAHELGMSLGLAMAGALQRRLAAAELAAKLSALLQRSARIDVGELRRGIAGGEIVPYYQPKISRTKSGWTVDGVEALARWQHPRLGLVMPNELIPLAEQAGLTADLTSTMLSAALRQVRAWQAQGLRIGCAVNLPPRVVTDSGFPNRVAALLAENGVDGRQLVLELTETAIIQDPTATLAILTRLRAHRVGLSLDDFGTGYSSLTQLYEMPFDEMKIDKSLVMNVSESREASTMVASLIELGHNLGLEICAEGVENGEALDALASMGCDRCQGYFISRPIPASEVAGFAAGWSRNAKRSPAKARRRALG